MTERKTKGLRLVVGLAGALALSVAINSAAADTVSDFYSGKTVTIVIAAGAGGSHSAYSLLLVPYLKKNMPGNPTFVVQHMPGAGGTKAANYLYNTAPRDGTYIAILLADTPLTARLWRALWTRRRSRSCWDPAARARRPTSYRRSSTRSSAPSSRS
jgi:tripartite-type tricarboxylate transporter receptor subunit TctC